MECQFITSPYDVWQSYHGQFVVVVKKVQFETLASCHGSRVDCELMSLWVTREFIEDVCKNIFQLFRTGLQHTPSVVVRPGNLVWTVVGERLFLLSLLRAETALEWVRSIHTPSGITSHKICKEVVQFMW